MSWGEWTATVTAWNRMQSGKVEPPTEAEFEAAMAADTIH